MTYGYIIAVAAIALVVSVTGYCIEQHFERKRVRASVWANLDNAYENGYFEPGEHCDRMTVEEQTQDLLLYAEDLDGLYYTSDIEPYVREWMQSKGLDQ